MSVVRVHRKLSQRAKDLLAHTLFDLAKAEVRVEQLRQVLGLLSDFTPLAAFNIFDRSKKGYLTVSDLTEFMWNHDSNFDEHAIENCISYYSKNQRLEYKRFWKIVTTKTNQKIKSSIAGRSTTPWKLQSISLSTTYAIFRVLESEVQLLRAFRESLQDLKFHKEYSIDSAYFTINLKRHPAISRYDLKHIFEKHEIYASKEHIEGLYSRLDEDGDGQVSFIDFKTIFQLHERAPTLSTSQAEPDEMQLLETSRKDVPKMESPPILLQDTLKSIFQSRGRKSNPRVKSQLLKVSQRNVIQIKKLGGRGQKGRSLSNRHITRWRSASSNKNPSPSKRKPTRRIKFQKTTPDIKSKQDRSYSPHRWHPFASRKSQPKSKWQEPKAASSQSPKPRLDPKYNTGPFQNPLKQKSLSSFQAEKSPVRLKKVSFKEFMTLLRDSSRERTPQKKQLTFATMEVSQPVEQILAELVQRSDFSVKKAFTQFSDGKEKINRNEFIKGLEFMLIQHDPSQVTDIFSIYDEEKDGFLNCKNFKKIFEPRDENLKRILENHLQLEPGVFSQQAFSNTTQILFTRFLKALLDAETLNIKVRNLLNQPEIFKKIRQKFTDLGESEKLHVMRINEILDVTKLELEQKDVTNFWRWLETDEEGYIQYDEFVKLIKTI